ncbi:hypothetical protein HanRHA438_Chr08g0330331 [Helianthus annuus]|nr:hypothetical protein HanRHA438_Chr08g0330331 [Helianthus annuus]
MSGVQLAMAPGSEPGKPLATDPKAHHHPQQDAGGGMMGSLRYIELQLVAFVMVFSAIGLVPLFDLVFPAITTAYLLLLSRLAFPGAAKSKEIIQASGMLRFYSIMGTVIGLFLPLAYVLGGFARGDNEAVRSATPQLFLLSFQILTENVVSGLSLFSAPDIAWYWFGVSLAVTNLAYFSINISAFLIPYFLPRAFELHFKERYEREAKLAADKSQSETKDKKFD